jgi:hypothetical protein
MMNEQVEIAIGGYEDGHPVNQNTTPLNGGTCSVGAGIFAARSVLNHDFAGVGEQNSCERSINGGDEPSGEVPSIDVNSGIYTREELVEIMSKNEADRAAGDWQRPTRLQNMAFLIDALIAIGAVRVKC